MLLATEKRRRRSRHHPRQRRTSAGSALPRVDHRTLAAKRFQALVESFEKELGGNLSAVDQSLVRQAANLVQISERAQADAIAGLPIDHDALVRLNSEMRRTLATLRAKAAKNKPAGPSLAEYLASKAAQAAEAPEADEE